VLIKTIVKRDGTEEEFEAAKLNKWGKWAAKTLKRVDWSSVVMEAVAQCNEVCSSVDLQKKLIQVCIDKDQWEYNRMAGKLLSVVLKKEIFEDGIYPSVKQVQDKLSELGLMAKLNYTEEEYHELDKYIDHTKDHKAAYYEIDQFRNKYALRDSVSKQLYETQQFTYMRMAMALAEARWQGEEKVQKAKDFYDGFSNKKINAPTPNFMNLGTLLNGYASCCIYLADDNAKSLAIGDHIAYIMTCMSAGMGGAILTRSEGDPVRNGALEHSGRLPYYRSLVGAINANKQAGRGGACTTYYNCYDPEVEVIQKLKNQRSPESKKIRGLDYAFSFNKYFARKVARNEDIALFNKYNEPELFDALYSEDSELFEKLYEEYVNNPVKVKKYINARDLILGVFREGFETGRHYEFNIEEANRHNPFKDSVYTSNLCLEYISPTKAYIDMMDLYSTEDHGRGEIGLCSLGAINVANIEDDEDYAKVTRLTLEMIDICIDKNDWALPHLGVTAKARRNAGVGIVGLAYLMAKKGLKYSSQEGKDFIHELAETHAWHLYNASLEMGKEYGNADWMHKTKWPEGWLPLDTYNRNVDSVITVDNKRDWESLRKKIIDNKGVRFSIAVNFMPSETSSKASGTTNALYPIRSLTLIKSDDGSLTYWAAPEGEKYADQYEIAWDVSNKDMTDVYAIIQKWGDQAISADYYRRVGIDKISSEELIQDWLYRVKMGVKTKYYDNSFTSKQLKQEDVLTEEAEWDQDAGQCEGGVCTL
jgi:ribonucleoside-diphosphate reductase alpha chain